MYKTKMDSLDGRVYTSNYRIYGEIYSLPGAGLADQLNRKERPFLPITSVMMYDRGYRHPPDVEGFKASPAFMAVPKASLFWIMGGLPSNPEFMNVEDRLLAVMFGSYLLRGYMKLRKDSRTSDHINLRFINKPFECLYDVSVVPMGDKKPLKELAAVENCEFVTLNLRNCTGISEL